MQNQVSVKDRELKSCNLRSEELSKKLEIINKWCEWLARPPSAQNKRPDRSPYFAVQEVRFHSFPFISPRNAFIILIKHIILLNRRCILVLRLLGDTKYSYGATGPCGFYPNWVKRISSRVKPLFKCAAYAAKKTAV